jgi:hypothetical protein
MGLEHSVNLSFPLSHRWPTLEGKEHGQAQAHDHAQADRHESNSERHQVQWRPIPVLYFDLSDLPLVDAWRKKPSIL